MYSAFNSSAILEASQENTHRTISSASNPKLTTKMVNHPSETTSATEHTQEEPPSMQRYEALL